MESLQNIYGYIEEYIDKLKPAVQNKYQSDYENIIKNTELMKSYINNLSKFELKDSQDIKTAFKYYDAYQKIINVMDDILEIINDKFGVIETTDSDLSQTYLVELSEYLNKLNSKFKIVIKENLLKLTIIKEELSTKLTVQLTQEEEQKIHDEFLANPSSVDLYVEICEKLLKKYYQTDKQRVYELLKKINNAKEKVLETGYVPKKGNKNNPMINYHNLIPNTNFQDLKSIIQLALNKNISGTVKVSDLKSIAKKEKIGIIILYSVGYNAVEYNIFKLTNWYEAKDYIQQQEAGINEQTLARFETIKKLDEPKKWRFDMEVINADSVDDFIILETINNQDFRVMSLWNNHKNMKLKKFRIADLLKESNKIQNYHILSIEKSLPNMFMRHKMDLKSLEEDSTVADSNLIRNEIFMGLMKLFKNVKPDKIGQVIHEPKLADTFETMVVNQYKDYSADKNIIRRTEFPFGEIFVSYLVELRNLIRMFKREVHDYYMEHPPNKDTNSENYIGDLLRAVLEKLISDKKNIYQALFFKDRLLNI